MGLARKKKNNLSRLTTAQVDILLGHADFGLGSCSDAEYAAAFESNAQKIATWKVYEDDLLEEWVKESPGRRPRLWWEICSPEPLRVMGIASMPGEPGKGNYEVIESQEEYLVRHGFCLPEEKALTEERANARKEERVKWLRTWPASKGVKTERMPTIGRHWAMKSVQEIWKAEDKNVSQ